MFVGSNKHMYDLAKQFNLTLCSHPCTFGADNKANVLQSKLSGLGEYGIWDVAKGVWQVKRDGWFWVGRFEDALAYYVSAGERVRRRFLDEVVTLATRVNYMQDIDTINLLSAHVSMAPTSEDVYSVAGGNWQVFDRMVRESRATLNFNTTVTAVQREGGKYTLVLGSNQTTAAFDSVIIAAPLSVSGLDVLGQKDVPVKRLAPRAPFNCLSILACLDDALACHQGTVLVKIFSHEPVDLDAAFERVEWQREQRWHSYPQLIPRNARYVQENGDHAYRSDRPGMPPIVMDERAGGGVYYVNGMESLFSTMESQTVAARHVVQLVVLGKGGFDSVRTAGADEPA
ncbi:hypothetical protein DL89DRAFT_258579 [Linderina pennispora]|uniref:Prenylcysteine lyase domain-containing protein n=1 Tax=Linderina pennispora TaxID=61395 RepID=A0A1Y1W5C6_9FUNG|nr:uncharacterized protein DL89DRAFT_258579 [Linderina pennispora]ORX68731.1 hypothetical protein DL89DRAFT_258579 [Linderina pennispora]